MVPRRVSFVGTAELFDFDVCRTMVEDYIREHVSMKLTNGVVKGLSSWAARVMVSRVPHCGTIRVLGSATLAMAYVATGWLDVYFQMGLKPWDAAAGVLIITEAGGRYSTLEGIT